MQTVPGVALLSSSKPSAVTRESLRVAGGTGVKPPIKRAIPCPQTRAARATLGEDAKIPAMASPMVMAAKPSGRRIMSRFALPAVNHSFERAVSLLRSDRGSAPRMLTSV